MNLEVRDVKFSYPRATCPVLENISFLAEPGDFIVLKGVSGSGKTTLLNVICGVIPKMITGELEGEILLGGSPLSGFSLPETAKSMSLLMPDPDLQLFFPVVEHEIAFGPENLALTVTEINSRVKDSLAELDLEEIRHAEISGLSYGQKKLIAFAALLALKPHIYLLDEPSSGLSPKNLSKLLTILRKKTAEGRIIIAADHDRDVIAAADRFIDLDRRDHVQD